MSDEQKDQIGQADDDTDDVEGHQMGESDQMGQMGAQEEPPDVEGHQLGGAAAAQSREP